MPITFQPLFAVPNAKLGPPPSTVNYWYQYRHDALIDINGDMQVVGVRAATATPVAHPIRQRRDYSTGIWQEPESIHQLTAGLTELNFSAGMSIMANDIADLMVASPAQKTPNGDVLWSRLYDRGSGSWKDAKLADSESSSWIGSNTNIGPGLAALPGGDFVLGYRLAPNPTDGHILRKFVRDGLDPGGGLWGSGHDGPSQSPTGSQVFAYFRECAIVRVPSAGGDEIALFEAFDCSSPYTLLNVDTSKIPILTLKRVWAETGPGMVELEPVNPSSPRVILLKVDNPGVAGAFPGLVYTTGLGVAAVVNRNEPRRIDVIVGVGMLWSSLSGSNDMNDYGIYHLTLLDYEVVSQTVLFYQSSVAPTYPKFERSYKWLDLACDFNGDLHFVYVLEPSSGGYELYYRQLRWGETAWTDPVFWSAEAPEEPTGVSVATSPTESAGEQLCGFTVVRDESFDFSLYSSCCEDCVEPPPPPIFGERDDRCPEFPADWQRVLANEGGARYFSQVIFDPDDQAIDLSQYFADMRAYTVEKDTELRNFVAGDTELEFVDPSNLFLPSNPGSFFHDATTGASQAGWMFKDVAVRLRAQDYEGITEDLPIFRAKIIGLRNTPGKAVLRLGNMFKYLLDRPIKANGAWLSRKIPGTDPPNDGTFTLRELGVDLVIPGAEAVPETWTITFKSDPFTHFEVSGSVSGEQANWGTTPVQYVTDNGELTIEPDAWDGTWVSGDQVVIGVGLGWGEEGIDVFQAMKEVLLEDWGAGLAGTGKVAESEFDAETVSGSTVVITPVWIEEANVLDVLQELGWHSKATVYERSDGSIGVMQYRFMRPQDVCYVCSYDTVMPDPEVDRTPLLNNFEFEYDFRPGPDGEIGFQIREKYPATLAENPSYERYQQLSEKRTVSLRGFSAGQQGFVQAIGASLLNRWGDPQELVTVPLKIKNINIELSTAIRLQILAPSISMLCEVVGLDKEVGKSAMGATAKLMKADSFLSDACGVLRVGRGVWDDCYVYG